MENIHVPLKTFTMLKPPMKQSPVGIANATPSEKCMPKRHKKEKKKFE